MAKKTASKKKAVKAIKYKEAELKEGEFHPAAYSAMLWFRKIGTLEKMRMTEAVASTALSGNRLAEICTSTLRRLEKGEPVSDRYLLGLCWTLMEMQLFMRDEREDLLG